MTRLSTEKYDEVVNWNSHKLPMGILVGAYNQFGELLPAMSPNTNYCLPCAPAIPVLRSKSVWSTAFTAAAAVTNIPKAETTQVSTDSYWGNRRWCIETKESYTTVNNCHCYVHWLSWISQTSRYTKNGRHKGALSAWSHYTKLKTRQNWSVELKVRVVVSSGQEWGFWYAEGILQSPQILITLSGHQSPAPTTSTSASGASIHSTCRASGTSSRFGGFGHKHREPEGCRSLCFPSLQSHYHCYCEREIWGPMTQGGMPLSSLTRPDRSSLWSLSLGGHLSLLPCSASPTVLVVFPQSTSWISHLCPKSHLGICFWKPNLSRLTIFSFCWKSWLDKKNVGPAGAFTLG